METYRVREPYRINKGKHFIGDFLPPDELERFMETYRVREPYRIK
jgi:hypothetical protein